jgi:hypothetical protein
MAIADSKLDHAYNEIGDLWEQVYDYEEASNKCCKAKGKQKAVVEPRKCARTDAYDTNDDLLSWQEGALLSLAPSVGWPTISEFATSVNAGGSMPQWHIHYQTMPIGMAT